MRTIAVSARSKTLYSLLKKARRKTVILEADGERFMLTSMKDLEAFEVGDSPDFAVETRRTAKNKQLGALMAKRREGNKVKARTSLDEVRQKLGLE